ncbi:uncharacterized protein LOC18423021 isoform X2 [Amborella trichopoda]|uniref:uncharacterized protein LOC18423021 isoform X2 n=1 Tax=Amborella trichopoda TaxID=13333 RepID=UPI0009C0CC8F|nr:uncharacterized protein LOC18423021 isoform X2 [Amborella trichopoda]|eukprot:XP_020527754.1 uncharacterized protein LOC18423021 isoform X2 [Amborella trichopoda]
MTVKRQLYKIKNCSLDFLHLDLNCYRSFYLLFIFFGRMDHESVVEFLGNVPLLQRLPSSSLKRIAGVVEVRHYNEGEYVIREGQIADGVYFIWDGKAEVCGSTDSEERNHSMLFLKQYDYFGHGSGVAVHQADVIALTKVTCLVLHHVNRALLQPKSIWNAEDSSDSCSMVEHILHLEPLEVDMFRGVTLPDAPSFGQIFGGQFIGHALAAASKTVDSLKLAHSLHCYFILPGDLSLPIVYQVHRIREGNNFATRRVEATQRGRIVFTLFASFQKSEQGLEHHDVMPAVPAPEMLLSLDELRERYVTDPRLPSHYRNRIARKKFVPWPIEIKFCDPTTSFVNYPSEPSQKFWFRAKGKLSDDPALHRCVVAYTSDLIFLGTSLKPHQRKGVKMSSLSLDHSWKALLQVMVVGLLLVGCLTGMESLSFQQVKKASLEGLIKVLQIQNQNYKLGGFYGAEFLRCCNI